MQKSKVLVINGSSYYSPFVKFGRMEINHRILNYHPESIRLAVLTGGSDVDPSLYGEKRSIMTSSNPSRDREEVNIFNQLLKLNIPIVGICRGAQFLCVMAGGKLCQHLDNHGGSRHEVLTNDNRKIMVNSLHHQMMLPGDIPHKVLATTSPRLSDVYIGSADEEIEVPHEYEVAYFNSINALGFQYHPEMMSENSAGFAYCVEMTEKLLDCEFDKD